MFEHILLEAEQEETLIAFVEASRNIPRDQRMPFHLVRPMAESLAIVAHPGWRDNGKRVYPGDVETLTLVGLLRYTRAAQHHEGIEVTPLGFKYYEYLKQRMGEPITKIESSIKTYVNSESFQKKYPATYKKWSHAEGLLWQSDSDEQLTTIGHTCREAMQLFASQIAEQLRVVDNNSNPANTVNRLRAAMTAKSNTLGKTEKPFLDALLNYWGTVSDLVQRQEHGGIRDGRPLIWEDARRLVFQTMIVMCEIDRALIQ